MIDRKKNSMDSRRIKGRTYLLALAALVIGVVIANILTWLTRMALGV